MEAEIVLKVLGTVIMFCAVCGKITKFFITKNRFSSSKEDYHCSKCNIIQTFKVK